MKILNSILTKIRKLSIHSSVPDFIFIKLNNFLFFLRGLNSRFSLNESDVINGKYRVMEKKKNSIIFNKKVFGFRKQGIMAFGNGIKQRGIDLNSAYILDQIPINENDIIIDIGANTGDLNIYFELKGINIEYHGIEPGLTEFNCLQSNYPNQNVYQIALSDTDGKATFFYKPEFGDSSLVEMNGFVQSYEVHSMRLDTFMKTYNLADKSIKLLKLEAEGFEPEIIMNCGELLSNIQFISADLGFERGFNQDSTAPQVINFLLSNGFEIKNVSRVRRIYLFQRKNILV